MSFFLKTGVLFIVFNRPETTTKVFEAIQKVKPSRLYIAADGPRIGVKQDLEKIVKVREIISRVNWPCKIKTLFRKNNLGCKEAVSTAITWFFEHEEEGIILEDDCVPHNDFFSFCENLLNYYRYDKKVLTITGNNFQNSIKRGNSSYYFSKYFHCWGWATWKKTWNYYDGNLKFWPEWSKSCHWKDSFYNKIEKNYWKKLFDQVYFNKINTWDYPFLACLWWNKGLTATPNVNLVTNIGFGKSVTHTTNKNDKNSNIPLFNKKFIAIVHPEKVEQDKEADQYEFFCSMGGNNLFVRWSLFNILIKIFKYLQKKLNNFLIK
jgi:hypothetical protein